MISTIILIGPMSAGKSTIATLLAEKLGVPRVELDELRWQYYEEMGYDKNTAAAIAETEGMMGLIRHWKPFEAHAVEQALATYKNCILDFGAGHSVFENEALFTRVHKALSPFPHVILLLPSPDLDKSVAVVNGRFSQLLQKEIGHVDPNLLKLNEHFVKHPSNHRLAKMTVYTQGQTAEETCTKILGMIQNL